jgi:hypothetical protein
VSRWLALVLALAGCDVVFGFQTLKPLGARHRKPITVTSGPTTLVDFPISVAFDADADLAAAATTGDQVAFTYEDGNPIDCEIVSYDPVTGSLDAWVRLPELPPGATTIELVYGPRETACAGAVWPATAIAAWHEPAANGSFHDRTSHRHDTAPAVAAEAPTIDTGIAGHGGRFDGIDDATCAPTDFDNSLAFGTGSFSYSVWVLVTASNGLYDEVWLKGAENAPMPGFDIELGTAEWTLNVADGSTKSQAVFGNESLATWVQLVAVVDRARGEIDAFTDGLLRDTSPIPGFGSVTGTAALCLGARNSTPFSGILDEPRLYSVALGADWIAAEHANLAARDTFMTVGPEQRY